MFRETHIRSIFKTLSWRFWATVTTALIVYILTGRLGLAITVGGIEVVSKLVLYFMHERLWDRIRVGKKRIEPAVLWFTGLSGSGKSTVAGRVYDDLKRKGLNVERLDGDSIRDIFPKTGFTREERDQHIRRVGYLASKLENNGVFVVASFISPYKDSREFVKNLCKNFVEIYISTPLEECERRDTKGLYAKARAGEIKQFTGISDPYESPVQPNLKIDTSKVSLDEASRQVQDYIGRLI